MSPHLGTPSRRAIVVLVACVLSGMVAGPFVTGAKAATTPTLSAFDSRLLYDMNHARAARGIGKLTVVAGTTDVAHHWSCHQAAYLSLAHDLKLAAQLDTHGSALWTAYGENVGMQSSAYGADRLFHAYMNDPSHRANILDKAFRYVGVWSKRHNGWRYNTVDFVGSPVSSYNYGYGATRVTC